MKNKIIISIMAVLLAFVCVFAACKKKPDEPTMYTVTYDACGGTVTPATAEAEKDSKLTAPTATYSGYTLDGWYKESAYTTKWDFTVDTVQSDITLYAKWTANNCTVTFNAGQGTVTPATAATTTGSKITEPTASLTGYTLEGWYKENTYTTKWDFSADTVQGDMTLYANWAGNKYTVTFDVNGGVAMQNATQSVTYGQAFNLGVTTRANYNFAGWTYEGELITNANGAGSGVWSYTQDITVKAKWSAGANISGDTDVTGLTAAIANMGYNYTAKVYYDSGLTWTYDHYCTADGIYKMYPSEWGSSGFIFKESNGEYLAYYFHITNGLTAIDEEPYKWTDGDPYTRDYVYGRDYQVSAINPEYYVNLGDGVYSCLEEHLYQQGNALVGESDPSEILIKVNDGYIDYISINNFVDPIYNETDSIWMSFSKVGSTSIAEFLVTTKPPFVSQLPPGIDPAKPQAPATYGSDAEKTVDSFDVSEYVNGTNDNALPALKAAIDGARESIRYNFEDYFDDTYYKGTAKWDPSSCYYIVQFEGYKSYLARSEDSDYIALSGYENYFVKSGGQVYRIYTDDGIIKYEERSGSFEYRTLGGNYFNKLNASMFVQSTTNSNVYTVKSEYLGTVCSILFTAARNPNELSGVYNYPYPSIRNKSVTITLNNGKFESIIAERVFTYNDGSTDDIQQMRFSFDYDTPLVMPHDRIFEVDYTADELVLKNAIEATGNNYSLDYIYYDGWEILEYYADKGVWKWIVEGGWKPSGLLYINDYAYFMELDNNDVLKVDDEIWTFGDGPKDTDGKYYRAWMNLYYLPLAQLDAKDFTRISDTAFRLKTSAFDKYEDLFFDFREEGGISSLTVILDDQGRISRIEATNNYLGTDSSTASVVYVGNIGTTELPV